MKKVLAIGAVVVLCATVSSCGGDDNDGKSGDGSGDGGETSAASYCDQLADIKDDFENIDFSALSDETFTDMRDAFGSLEDAAPDDVKDEWAVLGDTFEQFQDALDEAGISLDDLQAISDDPNNLPEGLDLEALQELGTKMSAIAEDNDLEAATDAISKEVKDECGFELDDSVTSTDESGS